MSGPDRGHCSSSGVQVTSSASGVMNLSEGNKLLNFLLRFNILPECFKGPEIKGRLLSFSILNHGSL